MAEEVPQGTITEVLAWVGDDPDRARAAFEAELGDTNPRSTLLNQLEPIADRSQEEAPAMSEEEATAVEEPVPVEIVVTGETNGSTVSIDGNEFELTAHETVVLSQQLRGVVAGLNL